MTIVSVTTGRDPPPPVTLPDASGPERAGFARNGKGFVKLIVRGALLELVTFGFYRFWLVTDIRRHLWSHTSVDGDRLEYTGRGRELLFGFLFALAILVPVYLGYFLPAWKQSGPAPLPHCRCSCFSSCSASSRSTAPGATG